MTTLLETEPGVEKMKVVCFKDKVTTKDGKTRMISRKLISKLIEDNEQFAQLNISAESSSINDQRANIFSPNILLIPAVYNKYCTDYFRVPYKDLEVCLYDTRQQNQKQQQHLEVSGHNNEPNVNIFVRLYQYYVDSISCSCYYEWLGYMNVEGSKRLRVENYGFVLQYNDLKDNFVVTNIDSQYAIASNTYQTRSNFVCIDKSDIIEDYNIAK